MKEIYQCEKCGKLWDSYAEAWNCENSHVNVYPLDRFDLHPDNRDSIAPEAVSEYAPGEKLPKSFAVKYLRLNEDGIEVRDENGANLYDVAYYQLSPMTRAQEKLRKEIADSVNRKSAQDRVENQAWMAERAAAKAAETGVDA